MGSSGGASPKALGDLRIQHSGVYHVDEEGPEIIARQSANGRLATIIASY